MSGRRACELVHWSSRATGARAEGDSRRDKEEGDMGVACCGRRGALAGMRGRPEVVGGIGQRAAIVHGHFKR